MHQSRESDSRAALTTVRKWIVEEGGGAVLAGIALSFSFVVELMPVPWRRFAPIVFLPFLISQVVSPVRIREAFKWPSVVWLAFLVCVTHYIALRFSATPFREAVGREIIFTGFLCLIFLLGLPLSVRISDMTKGFFRILIPVATCIAVLGLAKAALLERGYLLNFIYLVDTARYPAGSSLNGDYNLFGLSLLVASLGIVARNLAGATSRGRLTDMFVLAVLCTAGMLSGSRRFLVLVALVVAYWLVAGLFAFGRKAFISKVLIQVTIAACLVAALISFIQTGVVHERFRLIRIPLIDGLSADLLGANVSRPSGDATDRAFVGREVGTAVMNADPGVILGTISNEHAYGFDSRLDRWRFGLDLATSGHWLIGNGFAYHERFSCRFVACEFIDYPHLPLLSEWLIAGVPGFVFAAAMYLFVAFALSTFGAPIWRSGLGAAALAVIPYSMLSGDTILSVSQFLVVCLLLQASVSHRRSFAEILVSIRRAIVCARSSFVDDQATV